VANLDKRRRARARARKYSMKVKGGDEEVDFHDEGCWCTTSTFPYLFFHVVFTHRIRQKLGDKCLTSALLQYTKCLQVVLERTVHDAGLIGGSRQCACYDRRRSRVVCCWCFVD
jgi:hypothetical protein